MKKSILLALFLVALMFVSCSPSTKAEEEPVNPIVGSWIGRNEYVTFRADGTMQFIKVNFGGSTNTYEGTWSMTEDGLLNAMYVRRSGTLDIHTNVAYNSVLKWENENKFEYPDPYGGQYYFSRMG